MQLKNESKLSAFDLMVEIELDQMEKGNFKQYLPTKGDSVAFSATGIPRDWLRTMLSEQHKKDEARNAQAK